MYNSKERASELRQIILDLIDDGMGWRINDSNSMGNIVSFEMQSGECKMFTFESEEAANNFLDSVNMLHMAIMQQEFSFTMEVLKP